MVSMQPRAVFVATAVLVSTARLRAEPPSGPPLPVRITYHADAECPTAEDFRNAVARRAPELADAEHGEPAREFSADVSERPDGRFQGKLEISEPSGARATRRLEGDDCHEVSEALAFIVAELGRSLRIEPDESVEAPPAVEPVPPVAPEPAKAREEPPEKKPPEKRFRWEAGIGLDATNAPSPDWLLGPSVYVEVGRSALPEPAFLSGRLSAHYAKSGIIHGEIGNAEIRWVAFRAELCGPRLHSGYFSLGGCALFDAGEVEGKGAGSADPTTRASLWLAPGLLARVKATILPALVVLGVEGGLFVPLIRPRFYFGGAGDQGTGETVHEVPAVGSLVALDLGVLFP